jgi:excisionase family DNA binding protein
MTTAADRNPADAQYRGTASTLDRLLTVDDVAVLLQVSRSWVYEHTRLRATPRSDRLPFIKIGKYVRLDAVELRAFLEKKCRLA